MGQRKQQGITAIRHGESIRYIGIKHRLRRHAIAELVRVRDLDRRRHQVTTTTKRPEFIREKDTNQGLLFGMPVARDF